MSFNSSGFMTNLEIKYREYLIRISIFLEDLWIEEDYERMTFLMHF